MKYIYQFRFSSMHLQLQHQTVGFIWLNDDVSIVTLVENFECDGFGNMIRFSRDKPFGEKRLTVT